MHYLDALERAIRRFIAPDVKTALQNVDLTEIFNPSDTITIPLQADVKVAHDKDMARFMISAKVRTGEKWLCGEQFFCDIAFSKAHDQATMIEYVFESAKEQMLTMLANDELKRIISHPSPGKEG